MKNNISKQILKTYDLQNVAPSCLKGETGCWCGIHLCIFMKCTSCSFLCIPANPDHINVAGCGFRIGIICIVIYNLCFDIVTFGHNIEKKLSWGSKPRRGILLSYAEVCQKLWIPPFLLWLPLSSTYQPGCAMYRTVRAEFGSHATS